MEDSKSENNMKHLKEKIINANNLDNIPLVKELISEYESSMKNDVEILMIKSTIAIKEKNYDEAIEIIQEGLSTQKDNLGLFYNLALVFEMKNYYEGAIYFYNKAFIICADEEVKKIIKDKIHVLNEMINSTGEKLLSIVVLAYNQVEYTKLCIDSIYSYCSHLDFELITVNNGSNDETQEYFKNLPNQKKINLNKNVQASLGANAGIKLAEGKYVLYLNNDIILTKNSVEKLINHIEANSNVGIVVPICNASSNAQKINISYGNLYEMHMIAKLFNKSAPFRYDERLKLMTYMCLMPNKIAKEVEGFDGKNFPTYFDDDDISFRIRRSGYKLILATDVFVHHFGSITNDSIGDMTNEVMQYYRKKFIEIHNVDSWSDALFDIELINKAKFSDKENIDILGIESFCGGTPLQFKNILREYGVKNINIVNYVEDKKYIPDLKTISDRYICGKLKNINKKLSEEKFDYIIISKDLKEIKNLDKDKFLDQIRIYLKEEGQLIYK